MRRCLVVSGAVPSATGAPDWRRFRMLVDHYRLTGLDVTGLILSDRHPGTDQTAYLRAAVNRSAFAPYDHALDAVSTLDLRNDFDVMHFQAPRAPATIGANYRAVRLVDLPEHLATINVLQDWKPHVDLFVTFERAQARFCRDMGFDAVLAPYLRRVHRLSRNRISGTGLLAGVWVEASPRAIAAARSFFAVLRDLGGGSAPNFVVAGPGAPEIDLPQLPFPITRLGSETEERAFYRGIDIAVCPDLGGHAPRYDVMTALELGATPLVSSSALTGVGSLWHLPHFDQMKDLAKYLFERGRDMRDGGLMAELRARADWTWSSLSGAAADQRNALVAGVQRNVQIKTERTQ